MDYDRDMLDRARRRDNALARERIEKNCMWINTYNRVSSNISFSKRKLYVCTSRGIPRDALLHVLCTWRSTSRGTLHMEVYITGYTP